MRECGWGMQLRGVQSRGGLLLLSKEALWSWVKRYIRDENKIWRKVVDRKYCSKNSIFYADQNGASPFWKEVMLAAKAVKFGYKWNAGNEGGGGEGG
jgi:hypothetical protein